MTVKDIELLYDYGFWANGRLFPMIAHLAPEQFTQTAGESDVSIRDTIVHLISAEWGWIDRCGGPERGPRLDPTDYPTVESVMTAWSHVEGISRTFLAGLTEEDLTRFVEFTLGSGEKHTMPLRELLHHGANHGVHHRGQLVLLLRLLGITPDDFDILIYYGEKGFVSHD